MRFLIFSTNFSEILLILIRTWRNIIKNVHWSLCEVISILVIFQWLLTSLNVFSKKHWNIKFHENPSSWSRNVPDGQIDGRTDGQRADEQTDRDRETYMTKLIVVFRNLANTPKNTRILCGPTRRRINFQAKCGCSIIWSNTCTITCTTRNY
jgi:hypothetical protein